MYVFLGPSYNLHITNTGDSSYLPSISRLSLSTISTTDRKRRQRERPRLPTQKSSSRSSAFHSAASPADLLTSQDAPLDAATALAMRLPASGPSGHPWHFSRAELPHSLPSELRAARGGERMTLASYVELASSASARGRPAAGPAARHVGATCPPKISSNDVHSANLAPALRLAPLAGELVGCWQHPSTGGS